MVFPSPYGMVLSLSLLLGYLLAKNNVQKKGIAEDDCISMALLAAPCMLIGARLYHVITDWYLYAMDPITAFYFWRGGYGLWGAVLGGILSLYWYTRYKRLSFRLILNAIAPFILLVIGLGRWGNILNQELLPFAYVDSFLSIVFFIWFMYREKFGELTSEKTFEMVLVSYAVSRFFGEFLRTEVRILGVFTINQIICIGIIVCVLCKNRLTGQWLKNIIH